MIAPNPFERIAELEAEIIRLKEDNDARSRAGLPKLVLTPEEVCELLGISLSSLYRLGVRGKLKPIEGGMRHRRYAFTAVKKFIQGGE